MPAQRNALLPRQRQRAYGLENCTHRGSAFKIAIDTSESDHTRLIHQEDAGMRQRTASAQEAVARPIAINDLTIGVG